METWRIVLALTFLLVSMSVVAWTFAQHLRRGWRDHVWIWNEAHHRAAMFAVAFVTLAGGKWLTGSLNDEVLVYGATGLGFVIMPYLAYIAGRFFGILHRARHGTRLS